MNASFRKVHPDYERERFTLKFGIRPNLRSAARYTYFIGAEDHTGLVKIGCTSFPVDRRVRFMQTGSPVVLSAWRVIDGDFEQELHERFGHLRHHGEWFDIAYSVINKVSV